jgi:DNA-binding response OmpR family regulator
MNILVVKDNEKIAVLLKAGLEKAGFKVDCA